MDIDSSSDKHSCTADCACCPVYALIQRLDAGHGVDKNVRRAVHDFKQVFVGRPTLLPQKSLGDRIHMAADMGSRLDSCSQLPGHPAYEDISRKALSEVHRVLDAQAGHIGNY
jgi:hypothetical protein